MASDVFHHYLEMLDKGEIFSCMGDSEWIIGKILMSGQCPYSEGHCQGGEFGNTFSYQKENPEIHGAKA